MLIHKKSTAFAANNAAWKAYVDGLGKLMAYHPNGSDAYSADLPIATENALANWGEGGSIRALTDGFVAAFGDAVAADHPEKAQIVAFGDTVTLAGLDFVIRAEGDDAYGIENIKKTRVCRAANPRFHIEMQKVRYFSENAPKTWSYAETSSKTS